MVIVGLTGSIGMGKSTVAAMFADEGAATWSADDAVHRLYAAGGDGAKALEAEFPEAIAGAAVDRGKLSAAVLKNPEKLTRIENIIHPLVAADRAAFLEGCRMRRVDVVVFDIPLLFENEYENQFDAVVVVTSEPERQRMRVLSRPGMTLEKFETLLAKQTPDSQKRSQADYLITTDGSMDETREQVVKIMVLLRSAAHTQ